MYGVFIVEKQKIGKAEQVLKDDIISRQSIAIRDAIGIGINKEERYILIEGSEESIKKAEELFKDIGKRVEKDEEEKIYKKIKEQEDDVANALGIIFGD